MSVISKRVLIRCDAAPEIGFGHVVRCLALADELLTKHMCKIEFAMLQGPQGFAQVQAHGYSVNQLAQGAEAPDEGHWLKALVTEYKYSVLILDVRTDLATQALQEIRESGVLIVCIDDPSDRRLQADFAFYPPVPQVERLDWSGFTGQYYVGWDWVLLRPQFAEAARRSSARCTELMVGSQNRAQKLTLLVTMGGSDPAGLTLLALEAIEKIDGDFRVLVVMGQGFMHDSSLLGRLDTTKRDYELFRNVTNMASLMGEANLAIASFGVTAYELAVLNVPTIYLCLSEDHADSASAFVSAELGASLGKYTCVTPETLKRAVEEALRSIILNKCVTATSNELLDGLGAVRIANRINEVFSDIRSVD